MLIPRAWRLILVLLGSLTAAASAGDWPHWRGPAYNGTGDEVGLPASWSKTENVAWVAPLPGPGEATPVVVAGRVYISSTANGEKDLLAICLDAASGKELWRKRLADGHKLKRQTLATPSPVADGKRSFFLFGTGQLFALDSEGATVWSRDLAQEAGKITILWTYRSSPLLHGGKLYVQVVHGGPSFLMALDPATGKTLWKQARPSDARGEAQQAYTTPIPYTLGDRTGILVAGGDALTCHDPDTGRELWRHSEKMGRLVTLPTPMADLICLGRAMGNPMLAVRLDNHKPAEAWGRAEPRPDVATPAFHKGLLYVIDDKSNALFCLEPASGKTLWREKLPNGSNWASPTVADDKIYCINMEGRVSIFQAGKTPKKLASIDMEEGDCLSTIAVGGGRLYIRTARNLYAIGKPAER